MGNIIFYGGLAGMGITFLLGLILIPVFRGQRKKMYKKIEDGEENE